MRAAERWGYLAEGQAHRYGVANGATLLLKIASGESGFRMGATSSAGAKGATQFMPEVRQEWIKRYGVDPWKSPEEAIHATAIYLHTLGLAHYNPGGGQSYIDYILHQPIGAVHAGHAQGGGSPITSASSLSSPSSGSEASGLGGELMHIGLVAMLVLGGAAMIGLGGMRLLGTGRRTA